MERQAETALEITQTLRLIHWPSMPISRAPAAGVALTEIIEITMFL